MHDEGLAPCVGEDLEEPDPGLRFEFEVAKVASAGDAGVADDPSEFRRPSFGDHRDVDVVGSHHLERPAALVFDLGRSAKVDLGLDA